MFIRMLQFLAQAIPFILLCLAARKANLNKIDRGRQVLMPFIALLYCTIVAVILTQFHSLLIEIMGWISGFLPFLSNAGISHYMNLFNLLIVVIFLVLKGIFLPILNKTWKSKNLMQLTSGNFYEYEEDLDKWLLKKEYEQVKTYCNGIYYAALGASVLIFVLGQMDLPVPGRQHHHLRKLRLRRQRSARQEVLRSAYRFLPGQERRLDG